MFTLWGCSTGNYPVTRLVAKVVESGTKTTKKCMEMIGLLHLPDRTNTIPACLGQDPDLTWDRDHFLHDKTMKLPTIPLTGNA